MLPPSYSAHPNISLAPVVLPGGGCVVSWPQEPGRKTPPTCVPTEPPPGGTDEAVRGILTAQETLDRLFSHSTSTEAMSSPWGLSTTQHGPCTRSSCVSMPGSQHGTPRDSSLLSPRLAQSFDQPQWQLLGTRPQTCVFACPATSRDFSGHCTEALAQLQALGVPRRAEALPSAP